MLIEFNDGACPPKPIQYDLAALNKRYPRAATYLKADGWAQAAHFAKAKAGKRTAQRILDGEDHDQVLADMDSEWSAYCAERMWDQI